MVRRRSNSFVSARTICSRGRNSAAASVVQKAVKGSMGHNCEPSRDVSQECLQNKRNRPQSGSKAAFAGYACLLCHVRDEAVEAENVEHAGEVVAECHQAPFAANLVEAADEEVLIA